MRLAIAFALILSVAAAQPLPDAQTLFERAQQISKSFHSLQFVAENVTETPFPGAPMNVTTETQSAYLNPGKTRMEVKAPGVTFLDVSDGETTWVYNSMAKQYVKIAAAQGPEAVMAAIGVKLPDPSSVKVTYKTTGDQAIEIDGEKHDCWVVEAQIGEMTLPSSDKAPPKMTGATMTYWIDKQIGIDFQMTMAMKMAIGGKELVMHQKTTKKSVKIDQPLAESLFVFTPPPDAKEVKELSIFGTPAAKPDLAGKPAPAFEVKSIEGRTFSLAALKGKPVLLDFWATWCAPCRKSMPVLDQISRETKSSDLVILGVNTGEDREIVEKFLQKTPFEYPAVLSGESGILESYEVTAYPTFILIGRDGRIITNEIGFGGEDQLRELIGKAGLAKTQ
ncbi:MAG TPA: redoxin family protein [Bryobacteraceae bacterium]|nr:redoxin family protein [Bryobacteraceae bacterium]